jgi:choline dehydrogenase
MRYQAQKPSAEQEYEFDYVIIGSGSAGATIAYRLGEVASDSLAVIDFRGSDKGPFIQMPAALSYPMNMRLYDWGYSAEAEPALNGRSLVCPRGKVIGGSSSINRMIYVRGHAGDYDHWQEQGATGWSFAEYLALFQENGNCR